MIKMKLKNWLLITKIYNLNLSKIIIKFKSYGDDNIVIKSNILKGKRRKNCSNTYT